MKKKIFKGLAISMAFSMLFTTNAFATPIDLANSAQDVKNDILNQDAGTTYYDDELTNEWSDGTIPEEVRVKVDLASKFNIIIPKDIILDGEAKKADYQVNVKGDIAGDQKITVVPDADFQMDEAGGKAAITATVTQPDTDFTYDQIKDTGKTVDGSVEAPDMTAGDWSGSFFFNIKFDGGESSSLPEVKATLNDYTWAEIAAISELGEAQTTYGLKVGDTKEMTLSNGETYNAEIIGFNHDDLADGSGKVGITFQFKEVMTTQAKMNSVDTNAGGWEASEMRTYVNQDVFALLPAELQSEIKEVDKVSDAGNGDNSTLIHTSDKLFLLSFEEVGFTSSDTIYFVAGQGTKYTYYSDNASRVKYLSSSAAYWWLRSAYAYGSFHFSEVGTSGSYNVNNANRAQGVAPAFCI